MEKLIASDFAKVLNNRQYGNHVSEQDIQLAKDNNLVIVYGYSDDCIEFRGAFYDEFSCSGGASYFFNKSLDVIIEANVAKKDESFLLKLDSDSLDLDCLVKFKYSLKLLNKITQEWCPKDIDTSWKISANFPHETFNIMEDDELFCIGIVFSIDDLK